MPLHLRAQSLTSQRASLSSTAFFKKAIQVECIADHKNVATINLLIIWLAENIFLACKASTDAIAQVPNLVAC